MKTLCLACLSLFVWLSVQGQVVKNPIPDRVVVLTFDDACASHYSYVAPLLKRLGFGATFFVCEFPPHFADSSMYMNWRQMAELDRLGFEVGNHTRSHPALQTLTKADADEQLDYIDRKCDSMGIVKPVSFAYPGYGLSPDVVDRLAARNVLFARVGGGRPYDPETDHPLLIPSWDMTGEKMGQTMESLKYARGGKVVVWTIHGVPDAEHPWVNTPPEMFERCMQYLADNGYTVIALRDLSRYLDIEKALKRKPDYTKKLVSH